MTDTDQAMHIAMMTQDLASLRARIDVAEDTIGVMLKERARLLSVVGWALAQVRECPETYDEAGHPMGWVPLIAQEWDENYAASYGIFSEAMTRKDVETQEPRDIAPELAGIATEYKRPEQSVSMGSEAPLHYRVGPNGQEKCASHCRACAVERFEAQSGEAAQIAAPAGSEARKDQIERAGIPVGQDVGSSTPAPAVCILCFATDHVADDCTWQSYYGEKRGP